MIWSPADLYYSEPSDEVAVILDGSLRLKQVYAPQGIADVDYSGSGTTYDIYFYSWKDVESWNSSENEYDIRSGATVVAKSLVSS
jgi:hypothetical protein